jgi:peptidyl-tRNA hydrolase
MDNVRFQIASNLLIDAFFDLSGTIDSMFYIFGLGNPGEKYNGTRHNIGRAAVEHIFAEGSFSDWNRSKSAQALYAWGSIAGAEVELVLPETFMNRSGDSVRYVVDKHQALVDNIIVIHDDIDLPFGAVRVAQGRGAGGNNGVQSIIDRLGSKNFVRIRIGIAPTSFWTGEVKRPSGGGPLERFVLKKFSGKEQKSLVGVFDTVEVAVKSIMTDGVDKAMNKIN